LCASSSTWWAGQDLLALDRFWTAGCINHAAPAGQDVGVVALRSYHEQFAAQFAAFSDVRIEVVQQIAENDRVVTHLFTRARRTNDVTGMPVSGQDARLATIRIDRLEAGKIAEHWSVADVAGLLQQLQR
jgi:predicted ester cyclase